MKGEPNELEPFGADESAPLLAGCRGDADRLAVTRNTVNIHLHRARQALRTLIERDLVGDASPGRASGE
jgi:hypothetical protein